jgi:hypothetical protein
MAELTDAQLEAALERGKRIKESEPRAAKARYDQKSERVFVDLASLTRDASQIIRFPISDLGIRKPTFGDSDAESPRNKGDRRRRTSRI